MAKCDACGNDYDNSFQVAARGKTHTFDSFECAIHTLAPTCVALGDFAVESSEIRSAAQALSEISRPS